MESNYGSDSGTDDDLPPSCLHRQILRAQGGCGRQASGIKRPGCRMQFDRLLVMKDKSTQELEIDAYTAVLRAFNAQSTALTWTKERLMCDLRKELRISEGQHRQLTEEFEAQQASHRNVTVSEPDSASNMQIATSILPPPTSPFPAYRKSLKTFHTPQFVVPLEVAVFQTPDEIKFIRPQAGKGRQVAGAVIGASTSKVPGLYATSNHDQNFHSFPLTGGNTALNKDMNFEGSGRGKDLKSLLLCREVLPAATVVSPLENVPDIRIGPYLGQRVQRLWPDDKKLYDAVIVDYDLETGTHALVYDMETPEASYEWVNFKQIGEGEIKFVDGPLMSLLGKKLEPPRPGGRGLGRKGRGHGRGRGKSYSKTAFGASQIVRSSLAINGHHAFVGPGKTLRKENATVTADMKETDLKEGIGPGFGKTVQISIPNVGRRGIVVKVPVIRDILEESKNLDEIVDLNLLANMKQKVDFVAEAFRTALRTLGDSPNEDAEGDKDNVRSSDDVHYEQAGPELTSESGKSGVADKYREEESPVF